MNRDFKTFLRVVKFAMEEESNGRRNQYLSLRSNEKLLLIEPKSKHSWGDRSFVVAAPQL